jgi:hypothetical protein
MRDLLAGHSTRDPEIVHFLSAWVYEELCHGRAIDKLLTVSGYPSEPDRVARLNESASFQEFLEAFLSQGAAWLTPRFIAVHMTWGAINEATAAAAYQALERRTKNPVLATLVSRMARQERRHMSFYWHQANKRMQGDRITQRLVQFAIKRFWHLVGAGVGGQENLAFIAAHLFGDEEARRSLVHADRLIAQLPGMEWFNLITERTCERALAYERQFGAAQFSTRAPEAASQVA